MYCLTQAVLFMLNVLVCDRAGQLLKQVQMLWQKSEICFMVLAILGCTSVFCLETLRKGKSIQSGRLIIGSSKTTNENKDDLLKKLHNKYVQNISGNLSNQPALIGIRFPVWYQVLFLC